MTAYFHPAPSISLTQSTILSTCIPDILNFDKGIRFSPARLFASALWNGDDRQGGRLDIAPKIWGYIEADRQRAKCLENAIGSAKSPRFFHRSKK